MHRSNDMYKDIISRIFILSLSFYYYDFFFQTDMCPDVYSIQNACKLYVHKYHMEMHNAHKDKSNTLTFITYFIANINGL